MHLGENRLDLSRLPALGELPGLHDLYLNGNTEICPQGLDSACAVVSPEPWEYSARAWKEIVGVVRDSQALQTLDGSAVAKLRP